MKPEQLTLFLYGLGGLLALYVLISRIVEGNAIAALLPALILAFCVYRVMQLMRQQ